MNPDFDVNSSGRVFLTNANTCIVPTTEIRDECLCHFVNTPNTWRIIIDNNSWPHTTPSEQSITIQNSFSSLEFGAWGGNAQNNQRITQSRERVFGHELCGHAFLMEQGIHPSASSRESQVFGRPSHQQTVQIENQIADEISGNNAPDRGVFSDPHQGESFGKITISNFLFDDFYVSNSPEKSNLQTIANFMTSDIRVKIDLIGHSDSLGTDEQKQNISLRRARNVAYELIRMGVDITQLRAVRGVSDSDCATNGTNDALCRKVEAFMFIFEASSLRSH